MLLCSYHALAGEATQGQSGVHQLDSIVVTASVLKDETPAQETPKSVSQVSEADLQEHAPQKLDEALRYTSGVLSQPYGSDNDTDWFKVRGFDAAIYLDGSRLPRDGYYTWLLETYGLEQVEVLKGPSSILYGESPPGGVVNAVQKRPSDTPQKSLQLEAGNLHHIGLGFDASDYLREDGSVRYRLVGLVKDSDGELDGTENRRYYFAPSLALDFSEQTSLTLMATFLNDDGTPTNPFFPAAGTLLDTPQGTIDPSTNLGEPGYDQYQRQQISLGYLLEHQLSENWQLSQNFNYGYNDLYLRSSYAFPNADPNATELYRGVVFRDGHNSSFSLDNKALGKWHSARLEHTALLGLELQYYRTQGVEQDNYAFGTINPFDPVYGAYTPLNPADDIDRDITRSQAGLYAQYQLKFDDQWVGVLGGRYDVVNSENQSDKMNQNEQRDDRQFSLNTGLMYLADSGVSPYINYSQSFDVLSTIDPATGKLYKPLEGEQSEIGIKYTPEFFDGYINLALFNIRQQNALVTNPDTYVATQVGEVTSKGLELEGAGQINDNLKFSASYTYTDAETDNTGGQGRQSSGLIPKHMASVWLDYDASNVGLEGWNFASGLRYVGKSHDNPASSQLTVPSATLWDAMIAYQVNDHWRFQLNANNILDKQYVAACDYYCYYGQSRSVMLSTSYRW